MELGDKLSHTQAGCIYVSFDVCSVYPYNTCTDNKHVEVCAMPASKVIYCT